MSRAPDRTPTPTAPTVSQPGIEVSTLSRPHIPNVSASSPDDDPTGVRALLSGLPEPDPMPDYLVARINASLTAAQSQRAASFSGDPVTPLVASTRRRPGRVLFALAGAAAAVALVAAVGSSLFKANAPAGSTSRAAAAVTSGALEARGAAPSTALDKAAPNAVPATPLIQIRLSETRYTQADFATQARTLRGAVFGPSQPKAAESPGIGPVGTAVGLTDCLRALGVVDAQMVRADLAFYEGAPAVIIVATTSDRPMAYALGRTCSLGDAAVLHPATPLP